MEIKNLFNDLKKLGKKKYYSRNGEEELFFKNISIEIEIVSYNGLLDIIISNKYGRKNYLYSESLTDLQKNEIYLIINGNYSTEIKCKKISSILFSVFQSDMNLQ